MDIRTILKNFWLALTLFGFFMGGCFLTRSYYLDMIDAYKAHYEQKIARTEAECEQKIEHIRLESSEEARQAIEQAAKVSREKEIEIYQQMANLQKRFTDNRDLIKRLHDNESTLCQRGDIDSETCNRELRECRRLLEEGAALVGESIEILQQQRVLAGTSRR